MLSLTAGILSFFTILISWMKKKSFKSAPELMARTITFWWMLAIFAIAVFVDPIFALAAMTCLCALGFHEYMSFKGKQNKLEMVLSYCAFLLLFFAAYFQRYDAFLAIMPLLTVMVITTICVLRNQIEEVSQAFGYLFSGLLFFGVNFGHGIYMVNMGIMTLIYCVFLTEIRDLISYWIGKGLALLQKRFPDCRVLRLLNTKIAERVSPNKTWGVGLLAALIVMVIAWSLCSILPEYPKGHITPLHCAVIGFAIGWFGLMGDLAFSMIKRDVGIKDSGTLLPGHTGVIDRVDSLVFTLPVTFHLIFWFYF